MAIDLNGLGRSLAKTLPTDIFSRLGLNKTNVSYDDTGNKGRAPQNLGDFVSEVAARGLARPNWYYVLIHTPFGSGDERLASLFCNGAELPAININSTGSLIQGFQTEMPYGASFPDVTMSFYLDSDFRVKTFFDKWVNKTLIERGNTYEVEYWNNYVSDVVICQIDSETDEVYQVTLKNAWPKAVSGVHLISGGGEVASMQVVLTYERWIVTKNADGALARIGGKNAGYSNGIKGMFESFKGILNTPAKFIDSAKNTISKITNIFSF